MGNAWLVKSVKVVDNADQEVAAIRSFDPKSTAVVNKSFGKSLEGFTSGTGEGEIKLTDYQPNYLKYDATVNSGSQLAVFSEISILTKQILIKVVLLSGYIYWLNSYSPSWMNHV